MLEATDARRREIELAGFFLGERDELFDRVDRNARMDGENVWAGSELDGRGEGFDRIVRQFVEGSIDRVRGRDDEQGVTIGLRFCRGLSADNTSGPATVVWDYLLAETFGQFGGDEAPHDVVAPAWRKRNDEAHGLGRIALRRCRPAAQRNRTNEDHDGETCQFDLHFIPPYACLESKFEIRSPKSKKNRSTQSKSKRAFLKLLFDHCRQDLEESSGMVAFYIQ